ncbi:hypothetical protein M9Y10_044424 [Tritrichomonas musculus]|uniref:Uncharacterized protein n=1 Tax=Tritrichomonas musculus TaxID=1915356 RepID=A0ABR2JT38_9EUKA
MSKPLSNENENDVATLFFTQLKVENEIQNIRQKIKTIRNDSSIPEPIRALELSRLFEVHNKLEIEFMRQQEDYLRKFLVSLKLDELDVKPLSEGTLKCHILKQAGNRRVKGRSKSSGFIDAFSDQSKDYSTDREIVFSSDILVQRKSEINFELRRLSFKESLTPEEKRRRQELVQMLHNISGQ